jgi:hypothetical protein
MAGAWASETLTAPSYRCKKEKEKNDLTLYVLAQCVQTPRADFIEISQYTKGSQGLEQPLIKPRSFLLNRSKHVYLLVTFEGPEGFTQNLKSIFLVQGSAIWGSGEIDFHAFFIGTLQTPF